MDGFETVFDRFFGRRGIHPFGRRRSPPTGPGGRLRRGSDRRTSLAIGLEEAYQCGNRQVTVNRTDPCSSCDGRGFVTDSEPEHCPGCNGRGHLVHVSDTGLGRTRRVEPCDRCHGSGEVPGEPCPACDATGHVRRTVSLDVDVPAGVESGHTVRVDGEGDLGRRGGGRGDAVVEIEVADHPRFARRHDDLYTAHLLSFPQLVFGDTVAVPTLDRSVEMTVPPNTQSGETFRLRGRGMPRLDRSGHGDLFVRIQLVTPAELSPDEREAIRAFGEAGDPDDASRPSGNPTEN